MSFIVIKQFRRVQEKDCFNSLDEACKNIIIYMKDALTHSNMSLSSRKNFIKDLDSYLNEEDFFSFENTIKLWNFWVDYENLLSHERFKADKNITIYDFAKLHLEMVV